MSPQKSASPTASGNGLPISSVAMAPRRSACSLNSSPTRATIRALSVIGTSRQDRKASAEAASVASTSASVAKSNVCTTSPVAGLTTW